MAHELINNELIMLSSLAYYKEFSDFRSINLVTGEKHDVGTFINYALNRKYETCFDGCNGKTDEDLGMTDILNLVKQNPRLTRLEIVYPDGFKNDDEKYKWRRVDSV